MMLEISESATRSDADVAGGVNANRTDVQIFDCNGTKSQQWRERER